MKIKKKKIKMKRNSIKEKWIRYIYEFLFIKKD